MSREKWIKDSFIVGMIGGTLSLIFFFYLITAIRAAIINYSGNIYMMRPPAVQLFTMLVNVILFRIIMLNLDKEKTAKGFLFITVVATFAYFFVFYRINK